MSKQTPGIIYVINIYFHCSLSNTIKSVIIALLQKLVCQRKLKLKYCTQLLLTDWFENCEFSEIWHDSLAVTNVSKKISQRNINESAHVN